MLTEKERLILSLDAQDVDRPPCICPGGMMNMVTTDLIELSDMPWPEAHTDPIMMAKVALASYEQGCFENVGVPFDMVVEAEALGASTTLGSIDYEPHVTEYAIASVNEWGSLAPIDLENSRAAATIGAIRYLKGLDLDVPIIGNITGPVSTASSTAEPVQFYKDMRKNNAKVHEFMEFVTQECIRFALAQIEAGADVICISDPSGTGEILGKRFFDEFTVTYLNKLLAAIKPTGVKTIVHICGQMHSVFEQVAKVESDALSFDAVVPLRKSSQALPGRVLMGNISTFAIERSDASKIATLTRNCVKNGSKIISPACGLGMHSPLSNVQTILKTLKEEGFYDAVAAQDDLPDEENADA